MEQGYVEVVRIPHNMVFLVLILSLYLEPRCEMEVSIIYSYLSKSASKTVSSVSRIDAVLSSFKAISMLSCL